MKRGLLSAVISVLIVMITGLGIFTVWYLNENVSRKSLAQLSQVYVEIPHPGKCESNSIEIQEKLVSKYLSGERVYEGLSGDEGMRFFENYAVHNGWEIKVNSRYSHSYYLNLKKDDVVLEIYHEDTGDQWHMMLVKEDLIWKFGL